MKGADLSQTLLSKYKAVVGPAFARGVLPLALPAVVLGSFVAIPRIGSGEAIRPARLELA